MNTQDLTGPDLEYWVARANLAGHPLEVNVVRSHFGSACLGDPGSEASKRDFVRRKLGEVLPDRTQWA